MARSPRAEQLALHMMFLVGRNFYHGLDPMSVSELANQLSLPAGLVNDFMEMFYRARLVLPLADEETFVLGRDPETIGIKEILDCMRNAGKIQKSQGKPTKENRVSMSYSQQPTNPWRKRWREKTSRA
jgi:DNA-binding IscR family transcriptional regulator